MLTLFGPSKSLRTDCRNSVMSEVRDWRSSPLRALDFEKTRRHLAYSVKSFLNLREIASASAWCSGQCFSYTSLGTDVSRVMLASARAICTWFPTKEPP